MKMKESMRPLIAAAAVLAIAYLCRLKQGMHPNYFCSYLRSSLHTIFFTVWGFSLYRRIIQSNVRKYLVTVSALMVVWIILKTLRYFIFVDMNASRYIWYLYYAPLLGIPFFAFLASYFLGKSDSCRLPNRIKGFYIPTMLLFLLVMTNDLHQWVFVFPPNASVFSPGDYRYGLGYWLIVGWMVCCGLGFLTEVFRKCRVQISCRSRVIPLIPFGFALIYVGLYAAKVPYLRVFAGDMSIVFCVLFAAVCESCIQCRMIPTNTRYGELFHASVNTSAQIIDRNYVVRYAAHSAESIPEEHMREAEKAPVMVSKGKQLHSMPIRGGYVIWTEDMSELLRVKRELEETQEELQERCALLQYEYEREKEIKVIEEQNRLYDLLQSKTQRQIDQIRLLTEAYQKAPDGAEKRQILSRITVLGSYIKRRKDMVLSLDATHVMPVSKLRSALRESFQALKNLNVSGSFLIQTKEEDCAGEILTLAYDFFEAAAELSLDSLRSISVRICPVNGCLRINLLIDCDQSLDSLREEYPQAVILSEDDGIILVLPLEGGNGS